MTTPEQSTRRRLQQLEESVRTMQQRLGSRQLRQGDAMRYAAPAIVCRDRDGEIVDATSGVGPFPISFLYMDGATIGGYSERSDAGLDPLTTDSRVSCYNLAGVIPPIGTRLMVWVDEQTGQWRTWWNGHVYARTKDDDPDDENDVPTAEGMTIQRDGMDLIDAAGDAVLINPVALCSGLEFNTVYPVKVEAYSGQYYIENCGIQASGECVACQQPVPTSISLTVPNDWGDPPPQPIYDAWVRPTTMPSGNFSLPNVGPCRWSRLLPNFLLGVQEESEGVNPVNVNVDAEWVLTATDNGDRISWGLFLYLWQVGGPYTVPFTNTYEYWSWSAEQLGATPLDCSQPVTFEAVATHFTGGQLYPYPGGLPGSFANYSVSGWQDTQSPSMN